MQDFFITEIKADTFKAYVQELSNYYQPSSPLEMLQIERIAHCRSKLNALYELEEVKLQLVTNELIRSPQAIMQSIGAESDFIKSLALKFFKGEQLNLPMLLTLQLLEAFDNEIQSIGGRLQDYDYIKVALPELSKFIHSTSERLQCSNMQVIDRLKISIEDLIASADVNEKFFDNLLDNLERRRQNYIKTQSGSVEKIIHVDADEVNLSQINQMLSTLAKFHANVQKAQEIAKDFLRTQDLMLKSISLDGAEADRLLRMQTAWERRLSLAVGELMALLAKRLR